jgi:hypothetical protein
MAELNEDGSGYDLTDKDVCDIAVASGWIDDTPEARAAYLAMSRAEDEVPRGFVEPKHCVNSDPCPTGQHEGKCCHACDHDYSVSCSCHMCCEQFGCKES